MRLLLVHPGPAFSTNDVWYGLRDGLRELGHKVYTLELSSWASAMGTGLRAVHKQAGLEEPSRSELVYACGHPIYAKILRYGIQATIIITAEHWHPDHTTLLRRANMPVGVIHTESPYRDDDYAVGLSMAPLVWCNDKDGAERLQEAFRLMEVDTVCKYLPTGYHPQVHYVDDTPRDGHDVVFVGTGFAERINFLSRVDWTGIDFGIYGHWSLLPPTFLREYLTHHPRALGLYMRTVSLLRGGNPLLRHIRGGIITNTETANLYRRAAIGLNLFRTSTEYGLNTIGVHGAYSIGPRLYELAATGTFALSEYRPEVADIFGDLVPTFETPDELQALLHYWLGRPEERARISSELPGVIRGHSYRHRARQLIRDLESINVRTEQEIVGQGRPVSSG